MTGPRQVSRIAHKTRRLRARLGYGQRTDRGRFSGDVGPIPLASLDRHVGKRRYSQRVAERRAKALRIDAYPCGDHWHVGHPIGNADA